MQIFYVNILILTSFFLISQLTIAAPIRATREFTLPNGIEGIAVSLPRAINNSIAISLPVGHLDDPPAHQGMAHFLEHMLFMGSKKYPSTSDYQEYVNNRNGSYNAYTSRQETNYYLELRPNYFTDGLDRLAQFFIAPLFDPSALEDEKNAINNEFQRFVENDFWRLRRVQDLSTAANHPMQKFWVGNLTSLAQTSRENLVEFFEKFYGPERMKIAIMGPQSLDELVSMVEKNFGQLTSKNSQVTITPSPAPNDLPQEIKVQAATAIKRLNLSFYLPRPSMTWMDQEIKFLDHLLSLQHSTSLYRQLQEALLITKLQVYHDDSFRDFSIFSIFLELTDRGEQERELLVEKIFSYLQQLQKSPEILQEYFPKFQKLQELSYRELEFSAKGDEAASLANALSKYGTGKDLLEKLYLTPAIDWQNFQYLISLLSPQKVQLVHVSNHADHQKALPLLCPYWKVPYQIAPISPNRWGSWETAHEQKQPSPLSLATNRYLPEEVKMVVPADPAPLVRVQNLPSGKLLVKTTGEFQIPKVITSFDLWLPTSTTRDESIKVEAIHWMLSVILGRYLSELNSSLQISKQSINVVLDQYKWNLTMAAYPQTAQTIWRDFLEKLQKFPLYLEKEMSQELFQSAQEEITRNLLAMKKQEPANRGRTLVQLQLNPQMIDPLLLAAPIQALKVGDLLSYWQQTLESFGLEGLVYGNTTVELAQQFYRQVLSTFHPSAVFTAEKIDLLRSPTFPRPPSSQNPSQQLVEEKGETVNSGMLLLWDLGPRTARNQALGMLLGKIAPTAFFGELREKQQLGYIVDADVSFYPNFIALNGVIQSSQYSAPELLQRTKNFWENFSTEQLDEKTLTAKWPQFLDTVRQDLKDQGVSFLEHYQWLAARINQDNSNLLWPQEVAQELDQLTPQDLIDFYHNIIKQEKIPSITALINPANLANPTKSTNSPATANGGPDQQ